MDDLLINQNLDFFEHGRILEAQPPNIQLHYEEQAHAIASILFQPWSQLRIKLPEFVMYIDQFSPIKKACIIPEDLRSLSIDRLDKHTSQDNIVQIINSKFSDLESIGDLGVSLSLTLIKHTTAQYLVKDIIPKGQMIVDGTTSISDISHYPTNEDKDSLARGVSPTFIPSTQNYYLPQWIAFDERDNLTVASLSEAEAILACLKHCVDILNDVSRLYPPITTTEGYQEKYNNILGQLVDQGRALGRYHTKEIINLIQKRASANDLNRGLSLTLLYFDDQSLKLNPLEFVVIPRGRIQFVPAFVVCAVRQEQEKVVHDDHYNMSNKHHLIALLRIIEHAFESKYTPHAGGIELKIHQRKKGTPAPNNSTSKKIPQKGSLNPSEI